jgi:hypothetical protein
MLSHRWPRSLQPLEVRGRRTAKRGLLHGACMPALCDMSTSTLGNYAAPALGIQNLEAWAETVRGSVCQILHSVEQVQGRDEK